MTVKSCGTASGRSIRCAPMFCLIVSPQHREASMAAQSHDLTSRTFAPNVCLSINSKDDRWAMTKLSFGPSRDIRNTVGQFQGVPRHPSKSLTLMQSRADALDQVVLGIWCL